MLTPIFRGERLDWLQLIDFSIMLGGIYPEVSGIFCYRCYYYRARGPSLQGLTSEVRFKHGMLTKVSICLLMRFI